MVDPLKEAVFVAVGFGVLALQRANVKRIEFERQHGEQLSAWETGIEQALGRVEETLPEPARTWLHDARAAGAATQDRVRHLLGGA